MKISIEMHGTTCSVEREEAFDGQDINEVVQSIKGLLVAVGYHPSNVDDALPTDGFEWFPDPIKVTKYPVHPDNT